MKIDKSAINHNAIELINDEGNAINSLILVSVNDINERDLFYFLGKISGIIEIAENMKEVLEN